ncbi:MAG: LysR family transcriptional regulator [Bradyrhizobium sp.]
MTHRQSTHIPIEIIRTVVAISETGSLSKAGERLGLSQPAISSQIKRLQSMIGGSLFLKTANGTTTTELGKLALRHARRILDANDQMLRLGGNPIGPQPLRLGLSTLFVPEFVQHQTREALADIFIHTDHSTTIGRGLIDGYIDLACIYENEAIKSEIEELVINEFEEPLVWVRSNDFVLSPGAPIPLLTWPGDDWMIRTMVKQGLSYRIVFNSPDYHARLAVLRAGIGVTAIPKRMVPPDLICAREYYLPPLPPIKALLCARLELDNDQAWVVTRQLSELFFDSAEASGNETTS